MTAYQPSSLWQVIEWADEGASLPLGAPDDWSYETVVVADVAKVEWSENPRMPWVWDVRPTSAVTEYPEMYARGEARTMRSAQRQAEAAARTARRHYTKVGTYYATKGTP